MSEIELATRPVSQRHGTDGRCVCIDGAPMALPVLVSRSFIIVDDSEHAWHRLPDGKNPPRADGCAMRRDTMLSAAHSHNLSVVMVGAIPWYRLSRSSSEVGIVLANKLHAATILV